MKRISILMAVCFFAMIKMPAFAQDSKNKPSLSFGADAAVPTGDLSLITPLGIGASTKLILPVSNNLAVTVSAGYLYYFKKTVDGEKIGGFHAIPLKAGLRISAHSGLYFEPQAGYTSFGADGMSDGAFTFAGNIGYVINKKVDISARYENASKDGATLAYIGFTVAYNFSLGKK